jgi:C-terminal processing protease CtpA/Prc
MELELGEKEYRVYKMDYEAYGDVAKDYAKLARDARRLAYIKSVPLMMPHGRLGLKLKDLDDDLASYFDVKAGEGVLVLEVVEDSPAEEAGVKSGDVVIMIGEEKVSDSEDLVENVYEYEVGDEVALVLVRKGKEKKMQIILEEGDDIFTIFPGEKMHKTIEIPEFRPYEYKIQKSERMALEKEIEHLKQELKMLEKRLEKMEKK